MRRFGRRDGNRRRGGGVGALHRRGRLGGGVFLNGLIGRRFGVLGGLIDRQRGFFCAAGGLDRIGGRRFGLDRKSVV